MTNRDIARETAFDLREQGYTWEYIGAVLEVSRQTAKRLFTEYTDICIEDLSKYTEIPISKISVDRFKPLQIYGDAIVSCDWHIPLHSERMVNSLLEIAYKNNVKKLIIAGDFFHMDQFSHFLPHQAEASFEIEREEGTNNMNAALDVFDEIYFSLGNHDFRVVKFLGYRYSFEESMRWVLEGLGDKLNKIKFTNLDYVIYHPNNNPIRVCHPKNFSKIPLTVARSLVPKYLTSVFTAHSHHFAQGVALDGKNRVYDGGGLFNPAKTEYIQATTTHHTWVQGFYMWKEGLCHPFSPVYGNL